MSLELILILIIVISLETGLDNNDYSGRSQVNDINLETLGFDWKDWK